MIQAWGITDKGAVRPQNQDAFYIRPAAGEDPVIAIVCDGMGGAKAGDVASTLAVERCAAYLTALSGKELLGAPGQAMAHGAGLANEAVYDRALGDADCYGMGTTMVSAVVTGERATVLNIGDSRAYRIGPDGILKVTRDHSLVEEMVYRGQITPEEARQHPQKHYITRSLGSEPAARVDLYDVELAPGDILLLCSDGLSNALTDAEIYLEVMEGGAAETCCERLLSAALDRGATDNVTAVLIQVG